MADVLIEVLSPLKECFLHCEVHCVRECCGIDAISTDPDLIAFWTRKVGVAAAAEALRQIDNIITVFEDHSQHLLSPFLNHYTYHEAARLKLLEFLTTFRAGLASGA